MSALELQVGPFEAYVFGPGISFASIILQSSLLIFIVQLVVRIL
jgi:hypothetical protein